MDLCGLRLLAPGGVPGAALPHSFVAAELASAEQVLTELLGVRRMSEAETYRCATVCCPVRGDGARAAAHDVCVKPGCKHKSQDAGLMPDV